MGGYRDMMTRLKAAASSTAKTTTDGGGEATRVDIQQRGGGVDVENDKVRTEDVFTMSGDGSVTMQTVEVQVMGKKL